jgi:hypothetical protein
MTHQPLTNATVQLSGEDGNAFLILGKVGKAIKGSDRPELYEAFMEEAKSGDYDNLLVTCMKYVKLL